jgi:hypothetical protein
MKSNFDCVFHPQDDTPELRGLLDAGTPVISGRCFHISSKLYAEFPVQFRGCVIFVDRKLLQNGAWIFTSENSTSPFIVDCDVWFGDMLYHYDMLGIPKFVRQNYG